MIEALGGSYEVDQLDYSKAISNEMARQSEYSKKVAQVLVQTSMNLEDEAVRHQIESIKLHTERSLANEKSSRALSSLFGKFSLLNKIMQSMG
jgi:hypothetical protein